MSTLKKKNSRTELTPTKDRIGNVSPGINSDEAVTVGQTLILDGSGNISTIIPFTGANTHTGAETHSGNETHAGNETFSGTIASSNTTDSSSSVTGAVKTSGGLGVAKNATVGAQLVTNKNIIRAMTPYTAAVDTTVGWTLAEVKTALVAGCFKTTSAATVTLTLDSVANIITSFATANVTLSTGSVVEFVVDNSQGANTVTVAVDGGATIAVATPVITGGATLTLSTANKIGRFQLYLTSATTAILSRIV